MKLRPPDLETSTFTGWAISSAHCLQMPSFLWNSLTTVSWGFHSLRVLSIHFMWPPFCQELRFWRSRIASASVPRRVFSRMFWITRTRGEKISAFSVGHLYCWRRHFFPGRQCVYVLGVGREGCYHNTADTPQLQYVSVEPNKKCCGWLCLEKENGPLTPASLYYLEGHLNLKEDSSEETGTRDFIFPKASMPVSVNHQ